MKVRKLILLANAWKRHFAKFGDYSFPNAVFALLLSNFFSNEREKDVYLELETQDSGGLYIEELYYDILVLIHEDKDAQHRLCIPMPLIEYEYALLSMKAAESVPRPEHLREACNNEECHEKEAFWQALYEEAEREECFQAVQEVLGEEKFEEIFSSTVATDRDSYVVLVSREFDPGDKNGERDVRFGSIEGGDETGIVLTPGTVPVETVNGKCEQREVFTKLEKGETRVALYTRAYPGETICGIAAGMAIGCNFKRI